MKKVCKTIFFGVGLGILLVLVQQELQIERSRFLRGYWAAALVFLLGVLAFNLIYNQRYRIKMQKAFQLLETGRTEEYIAQMEQLLQKAKGRRLRGILTMNLAAGYLEAKESDKAISMLEQLPEKQLPGREARMCRWLNLCLGYFMTGRYEQAMELYEESQDKYIGWIKSPIYGGSLAALDVLAFYCQGSYGLARELLALAKDEWGSPRLQAAFQQIEDFMAEQSAKNPPR